MNQNNKISLIYSWPVIILAIIVFWPLAIVLVIRRATLDRRFALVVGKILGFVGICSYVVSVIGVLACFGNGYVTSSDVVYILFFAIAGFVFRKIAKKITMNAKSVKQYIAVIVNGNVRQLDQIASAMGKPYDIVKKDIQSMIDKGYLKNAYINETTHEIVLPVEKQVETVPVSDTVSNSARVEPVVQVVTCPCCGANNTITGDIGECEYCGSPLKGAVAVAGNAKNPVAVENEARFDVVLEAAGDYKINVIKVIKENTNLGLNDAKALVDSAPQIVKQNVPKEEAYALKKSLESVGATVVLW